MTGRTDDVALAQEGGRLTITLARPDKANAMTEEMLVALRDAVRGADAQVLVLTGAGSVFSGGADLPAARAGLARSPLWGEVTTALAEFPGLSVAAINGSCAGGAVGMAIACDLRVAIPTARFFYPVLRLGFPPQPSDVVRLGRLLGPARTKLILLGAEEIGAEEALRIGLVDKIAENLDQAVQALCASALAADPAHLAAIKQQIL
ncbi:enoyl-CoA hydratase/isomerase family protein [Palleronia sp. LCG004]|uniref:enoyl-CoA hydratase/isomerase family protein n=1 Tax=Palleronia sp. LCG004 TaxID=3079304 RepID=UPI00294209C5|nr:enoyl-CoA hydratase/isomerase family protein [Palleronia sp. LCG004]WOI56314.1 enoyl-CoA hydratase/isomerase family protein [Palleronia sp. LCG004]